MTPVYLFTLATRHAEWAATRQTMIASNIANATTPGYEAIDSAPFSVALDTVATGLARTDPGHVDGAGFGEAAARPGRGAIAGGGPVRLDQELVKADEVNKSYALDTAVSRSFHRMLLAAAPEHLMIDPLHATARIAAAGMDAETTRLRVISENIANARSTGGAPGSDPYRRKTVTFESAFDELARADTVRIRAIGVDESPFPIEHDPGNPAAGADGIVKLPNVNLLIEMADMREASRSYEAGVQVVRQARSMTSMTIDLLRNA